MRSNIRNLIIGNALGQFWPIRAVIFLYFLSNNATAGQYQMVQYMMFWTLLIIEVPTGYLGDRLNRRTILVLSAVLRVIGISLYAVGWNVWWFLIGEQLLGIAKSLRSGNQEAMLVESEVAAGEEVSDEDRNRMYRQDKSAMDFWARVSEFCAVFIGAFIGAYSLRATAVISVAMAAASCVFYLRLVEPVRPLPTEEARGRRGVRFHFRRILTSFRAVWSNPTLWCMCLCLAVVGAMSEQMIFLRQPFAREVGVPDTGIGFWEAALMLVLVIGSYGARWAHPRHDRFLLILFGIVLFGGMIGGGLAGQGKFMLIGLGAIALSRGVTAFAQPIVEDIIQKERIQEQRATIASIARFLAYVMVAVTGPLVQLLLEKGWTVSKVFIGVGMTAAVLYFGTVLMSSWFWRRSRAV